MPAGTGVATPFRMRTQLIELARDPAFIPHVYDYCDQWCRYCPVTARCFVFKAAQLRDATRSGRPPRNVQEVIAEAVEFTRAVAEATGTATSDLDAMLSDVSGAPKDPAFDDPLERLARRYAQQASRFVLSCGLNVWEQPYAPEATPLMVVAWFHLMIAARIYRALVSARRAAQRPPGLMDDANGSAKLALIGIDRSRSALQEVASDDDDARVPGLIELLDLLRSGVERCFPDASAFVRPGLDAPLSQMSQMTRMTSPPDGAE